MSSRLEEERKRKRIRQISIEESFKRQRLTHSFEDGSGTKTFGQEKYSSKLSELVMSGNNNPTSGFEKEDAKIQRQRLLLAEAAEKRAAIGKASEGSNTSSEVVVEPGCSRDNTLSDSENDIATLEFGDSPVIFPDSPPDPEDYINELSPSAPSFTSGGTPLSCLNQVPECSAPLPPLVSQPDHTVLIRLSPDGDFAVPPKPIHSSYRDKWDKNHVRMPCSRENLYPAQNSTKKVQSRWELIETTLLKPMKSSHDLQEAILMYNVHYAKWWDFEAMHSYFNEVLDVSEKNQFFDVTLPAMVRLALQLPQLCTEPIRLMRQQSKHSITMSQQQAACLLANAFFCTFPRRNSQKHSEYSTFPDINFNRLFQCRKGGTSSIKTEKLHTIVHYFTRVTREMPTGTLTYHRQALSTNEMPKWDRSLDVFTRLHVSTCGTIEDNGDGFLQVDFANKNIGGGVIGEGCVQEEIRFLVCPELILSRLFCERLDNNECLFVTGVERFSKYVGYAHTFRWAGNYSDHTPRDSWGRRCTKIVAIDAHIFHSYTDQFRTGLLKRELDKAYCGFYSPMEPRYLPAIATGNWGCGAFGGDPRVKGLIQMCAAAATARDLVYFTFGDSELAEDLLTMNKFLHEKRLAVGDVWRMFNEYSKDICQRSSVTIKIFPYIYQLQEQYEGDTDEKQSRPSTPLETFSKPESSATSTEKLMPERHLQHSC